MLRVIDVTQVPGYVHGLRAPGAVARIEIVDSVHWQAATRRALALLSPHVPGLPTNLVASARHEAASEHAVAAVTARGDFSIVLSCLIRMIRALQDAAGMPALGDTRVMVLRAGGPH